MQAQEKSRYCIVSGFYIVAAWFAGGIIIDDCFQQLMGVEEPESKFIFGGTLTAIVLVYRVRRHLNA